jgi:DnaJ domain
MVATDALITLMAPDGYYAYLNVPKPSPLAAPQEAESRSGDSPLLHSVPPPIDAELVKKQYRKLSRKHHPDRPGGDAATFRLLNRAQKVLLNPKLRRQYDMLGIDLDDDEEVTGDDAGPGDDEGSADGSSKPHHGPGPTSAQGIIQEVASSVLTSIFQLAVRTGELCTCSCLLSSFRLLYLTPLTLLGIPRRRIHNSAAMMGAVSVIVSKYRITLYPAQAFLAFIAYRIFQRTREPGNSTWDVASPILISAGLWAMHTGRISSYSGAGALRNWSMTTWWFWLGEALVIGVFTYNSASILPKTRLVMIGIAVFSALAALYLRGSVWNYATVVGLQVALALLVGVAFPFVEMILDAILNEKLKRVGDRVRAHHEVVEAYYRNKMEQRKTAPAYIYD